MNKQLLFCRCKISETGKIKVQKKTSEYDFAFLKTRIGVIMEIGRRFD